MISKKLKDEIWEYCRLNDIPNIDGFIEKMVRQGYSVEKYGTSPGEPSVEIREVEKIVEVIKEVVKEVPVEVIKEVQVIKEVPVETIKEVTVEKEVYVTDDKTINNLQKEHVVEIDSLNRKISDLGEEVLQLKGLTKRLKGDTTRKQKQSDLWEKEYITKCDEIHVLQKQLEEEKKKPKYIKKEIKLPEEKPKSSINWVSKDERDNDLYGE